jgi:hypothetical protein
MNNTLDLKPAVKQTVTPILQKAKDKCVSQSVDNDENKAETSVK